MILHFSSPVQQRYAKLGDDVATEWFMLKCRLSFPHKYSYLEHCGQGTDQTQRIKSLMEQHFSRNLLTNFHNRTVSKHPQKCRNRGYQLKSKGRCPRAHSAVGKCRAAHLRFPRHPRDTRQVVSDRDTEAAQGDPRYHNSTEAKDRGIGSAARSYDNFV